MEAKKTDPNSDPLAALVDALVRIELLERQVKTLLDNEAGRKEAVMRVLSGGTPLPGSLSRP